MVVRTRSTARVTRSRSLLWKLLLVSLLVSNWCGTVVACEMAKVLFGKISLGIIPAKGYETALIRNSSFDTKGENFGAFRGEISVERGGFAIKNNNQVVVGLISPALEVDGWDGSCDKRSKVVIKKVQQDVYLILNGSTPVGTITGRFPKNSFGVR